jgi:uncharacterized protein YdeI (YjbR/CyaY-like superfamily)
MPRKKFETLEVRNANEWRAWLAEHHASKTEIWLVFHKQHTGKHSIAYLDALEEALCHGWIDSLVKRLDDARYARKFTPRKPGSRWSAINRKRYAALKADGRLHAAGIDRPPTSRGYGPQRAVSAKIPAYLQSAIRKHAAAWKTFQALASSYRRLYVAWIDSAKQEETKQRRLREAVALLAAGKKLGLR